MGVTTLVDIDGEKVRLPAVYEVCERCHGTGGHDCWEGGMTRDEMDEQGPEFFEDYMSGMYDRLCTECGGKRVVAVVDRDHVDPEVLARYDESERERWAYAAEVAAERRHFGY